MNIYGVVTANREVKNYFPWASTKQKCWKKKKNLERLSSDKGINFFLIEIYCQHGLREFDFQLEVLYTTVSNILENDCTWWMKPLTKRDLGEYKGMQGHPKGIASRIIIWCWTMRKLRPFYFNRQSCTIFDQHPTCATKDGNWVSLI